jgi:diguanylate cyclase (GGDEF)-like protein
VLCLPVVGRGQLLGVLYLENNLTTNGFPPESVDLLSMLASQAAISLENARIYARLEELVGRRTAELEATNEQLKARLAEIEVLQASLREQAIRDPLTGLFNRRYLEGTLEREVARVRRDGSALSLVMIDVDRFKQLNDTLGHAAGDRVLQALGRMLLDQTRREDVACRYGGEEFVVVLPGMAAELAARRAERWRASFEALPPSAVGAAVRVTISIGIAAFPRHGATGEAVLDRAEKALYAAKAGGRNRVVVWDDGDTV